MHANAAKLIASLPSGSVKGGIGRHRQFCTGVATDGAWAFMLGSWSARAKIFNALAEITVDAQLATFTGKKQVVTVRNLDKKRETHSWEVEFSKCGRFYRRWHSDTKSEGFVVGPKAWLDVVTV